MHTPPLLESIRQKVMMSTMLWALAGLSSCATVQAQELKAVASQVFHNTTSYYNGYFISKESLKAIQAHIVKEEVRNYEEVLPPYPPYDTVLLTGVSEDIQKCIEKTSLIIKWHPVSAWVDDAYLILGQGRMFEGDWDHAIETFRYIKSKSDDKALRVRALILLMQVYLHMDKPDKAQEVAQFIQREGPEEEENRLHFLRTQAQYHHQKEAYSAMIPLLEEALLLAEKRLLRTRLHFILGQLYDMQGEASLVHAHFSECLKDNTFYDMWMEAVLRQLVNTPVHTAKVQKKTRRKFRRMLRERKHYELQHYIHYAWGHFEHRQGETDAALDQYKAAARKGSADALIGGRSYENCARIYYDDKRDLVLASYYYDSAVSLLPQDVEGIAFIRKRSEILQRFRQEYLTIQEQDSLLALAALPPAERDELFEAFLIKKKEEQKAAKKKRARRPAQRPTQQIESRDIVLERTGSWYFYNPTALRAGTRAFQEVWGNRPLEDHWRRSRKTTVAQESQGDLAAGNEAPSPHTAATDQPKGTEAGEDVLPDRQSWDQDIPLSETAQATALKKVEDAMYALGKIYYLELPEKKEAAETFAHLLKRFPASIHIPEVLYMLVDNDALDSIWQEHYKQRLLSEHGESIYAHLVRNPRYLIEKGTATRALQRAYDSAYAYVRHESVEEAQTLLMQRQKEYADNSFSDNAQLLEAILSAKTEPIYYYPMHLRRFLAQYPDSEVHAYASMLLATAERLHDAYVYSSRPVYTRPQDTQKEKYLYVLSTSRDSLNTTVPSDTLQRVLQDIVSHHPFEPASAPWVEKLVLREGTELVVVISFAHRQEGLAFSQTLSAHPSIQKLRKGTENSPGNISRHGWQGFLITEKNMDMMYASKDIEIYLDFFEQYVKK